MKKKILISIVTATLVLGMAGCGSDGNKKLDDNNTPPVVNKKPDNTPKFDIRKNGRLTISKELKTGDFTIDLVHKSDVNYTGTLFYIDDNNDGISEYIIANFKDSQNTQSGFYDYNKSSSEHVLNAQKDPFFTYTANSSKDSVKLHNLLQNDFFTINAYDVNDSWDPAGETKKLTFDIALAKGNKKTISGSNGLSMDIESNTTNISIKLKGKKFNSNARVYIDVNPVTDGHTTNYLTSTLWNNLEAKYKIENGTLKTYQGNYNWGDGKTLAYVIKDNTVSFDLKRSDIGNPDSIIVGFGEFADESAYDSNITIPVKNINQDVETYTF